MNKLLFVIGLSKNGGAEKRAIRIASLLKDVCKTSVFAFAGNKEDEIDYSFAETYSDYKRTKKSERINFLSEVIKKENPDIVFSFLPYVNFFTARALKKSGRNRTKHVVCIAFYKYKFKNKLLLDYSLKKCDGVYYQSLKQKMYIKTKKHSFVLPNPICIPSISKKNMRYKFMSVGRLEDQKDFLLQINSFSLIAKRFNSATLDIFGSGSQKQLLLDRINELDLNDKVFIHDYTDNIEEEYKKHDIFLFTTKAEGFPNALAEAMANNLICFSTYFLTGCEDLIIDNQTGFLIKERDADIYAKTVCEKLKEYDNCLKVAKNGYFHVKEICDFNYFKRRFNEEIEKIVLK